MQEDFAKRFAIPYPITGHPLGSERARLRLGYVSLLYNYYQKYSDGDAGTDLRFRQFCEHTFPNIAKVDCTSAAADIFKTRFKPFRFYSYRSQFLFDCIYLLAPENYDLASRICLDIKSHNRAKHHATLDAVLEGMFSGDSDSFDNTEIPQALLQSWFNTQHYLKTEQKEIVFTATMSAGKSTLINAIIGQELSFAKKAACTSTRMEFNTASPVVYPNYHIQTDRQILLEQPAEQVRIFTQGRTDPCVVLGYFESPLRKHRIKLIDTPGVDSSQNPGHKEITRQALSSGNNDILVYVIPVENYGSEDDYNHLLYIRKYISYKKILFVVNMMDSCNYEDDSNDEIMLNITDHLKSIGFEDPLVCPISAKAGGLIKAKLAGFAFSDSEAAEVEAYLHMYKASEYNLSRFYSEKPRIDVWLHSSIDESVNRSEIECIYNATGLPELEALIAKIIKEA